MIVLPERNVPRAKIMLPVCDSEWVAPSARVTVAGPQNQTRFRLTARLQDGHVVWRGWFDDRADFDAFLFAIAAGSIHHEPALWRLPTPFWPSLDPDVIYDFATVTFLTTTGSNQTYTSPSDWNNSNNSIETLAGGGGGALIGGGLGGGGAGGGYSKISNFSFATPGTTTATYRVGSAGTSSSTPTAGGDSWFNGTTLAGSSVGSSGGGVGTTTNSNVSENNTGGTGSAIGTTKYAGGSGWQASGGVSGGTGGGAAGKNGAGNSATAANAAGSGDAGFGGAAGSSGATGGAGGAGTEWDATHGSGGGGGSGSSNGGGAGGAYGGGAGGNRNGTTGQGNGSQGLVVVTYTPLTFIPNNLPMLGM